MNMPLPPGSDSGQTEAIESSGLLPQPDAHSQAISCPGCRAPLIRTDTAETSGWHCPDCKTTYLAAEENNSNAVQPGTLSVFSNMRSAPFTLYFCLLLAGLYLVFSIPDVGHLQPAVLDWVNLDLRAVALKLELWRLVTANLFHLNLGHIASNTFAILIFGQFLEARIGWRMMLLWSIIAMIGCDITSFLFNVSHSVGASGIAYGLQSAYIILTGKTVLAENPADRRKTLQTVTGYLILMVLINVVNSENINVAGHFGGALAGIILALMYPVKRPIRTKDYGVVFGMLFLAVLLLGWAILS